MVNCFLPCCLAAKHEMNSLIFSKNIFLHMWHTLLTNFEFDPPVVNCVNDPAAIIIIKPTYFYC